MLNCYYIKSSNHLRSVKSNIFVLNIVFDVLFSVDATVSERLGKFVNDSPNPNSVINFLDVNGAPKLGLFALTDIAVGQEICYDCGQLTNAWWMKKVWRLLFLTNLIYIYQVVVFYY